MNISVGAYHDGGVAKIDLEVLLRTRLLVQANSGGGKSWLLRVFLEQLFGKIPSIVIDPEGEYASLREKYDFVLIGPGGETPCDLRSAELVAHRLLELRASAIVDLYELRPQQRHEYAAAFLEALMNAPKKLWRPTVVVVDEAHKFCPEKGAGESVASEQMIALATAGRKRGYCAVFATQRLGKLRKDASGELLNRLVGPTFEDVDLDRAVDLLSVGRDEKREFLAAMRTMEPGHFWALGRAVTKERRLIRVGKVQTTHQDVTSGKMSAPPPPPTEKIKALLPKLADLPKEAEEKAQTVASLRAEIRSLKNAIRERPKEVDAGAIDGAVRKAVMVAVRSERAAFEAHRVELQKHVTAAVEQLRRTLSDWPKFDKKALDPPPVHEAAPRIAVTPKREPVRRDPDVPPSHDRKLNRCERAVASLVHSNPEKVWTPAQVAVLTGYALGSGGLNNAFGSLNSMDVINRANGTISAGPVRPEGLDLTQDFTIDNILPKLNRCEGEIWRVLVSLDPIGYSSWAVEDVLAQTRNQGGEPYAVGSGGVNNAFGRLSTLGMIERASGNIRIHPDMAKILQH